MQLNKAREGKRWTGLMGYDEPVLYTSNLFFFSECPHVWDKDLDELLSVQRVVT